MLEECRGGVWRAWLPLVNVSPPHWGNPYRCSYLTAGRNLRENAKCCLRRRIETTERLGELHARRGRAESSPGCPAWEKKSSCGRGEEEGGGGKLICKRSHCEPMGSTWIPLGLSFPIGKVTTAKITCAAEGSCVDLSPICGQLPHSGWVQP